MTKSEIRKLTAIVVANDIRASLRSFLAQQVKRAPVKPMKAARLAKKKLSREEINAETARLREYVFTRAGGLCEAYWFIPGSDHRNRCLRPTTDLDHWLGGNGRRRQQQSAANTWALCWVHHRLRTDASPSDAFWNESFAIHAKVHGYDPEPHVKHAKLKPRSTP